MPDPISYSFATPRLGLPLLFSGQSQKEVSVNEALSAIDLLLAGVVDGVASTPPSAAAEDKTWIVGQSPTGAFAGRTDQIAGWTGGGWRFIEPQLGMRLFDREAAAIRSFSNGWNLIEAPSPPSGGAVIDVEARVFLTDLIAALSASGIIYAA